MSVSKLTENYGTSEFGSRSRSFVVKQVVNGGTSYSHLCHCDQTQKEIDRCERANPVDGTEAGNARVLCRNKARACMAQLDRR